MIGGKPERKTLKTLAALSVAFFVVWVLMPAPALRAAGPNDEPGQMRLAQGAASGALEKLKGFGGLSELTTNPDAPPSPAVIIGRIVQALLTLVGVIVVILIIYAGVMWMTARGNTEQVTKAKQMMVNAIIGLAITLAAYSISSFVMSRILESTFVAPPGEDFPVDDDPGAPLALQT